MFLDTFLNVTEGITMNKIFSILVLITYTVVHSMDNDTQNLYALCANQLSDLTNGNRLSRHDKENIVQEFKRKYPVQYNQLNDTSTFRGYIEYLRQQTNRPWDHHETYYSYYSIFPIASRLENNQAQLLVLARERKIDEIDGMIKNGLVDLHYTYRSGCTIAEQCFWGNDIQLCQYFHGRGCPLSMSSYFFISGNFKSLEKLLQDKTIIVNDIVFEKQMSTLLHRMSDRCTFILKFACKIDRVKLLVNNLIISQKSLDALKKVLEGIQLKCKTFAFKPEGNDKKVVEILEEKINMIEVYLLWWEFISKEKNFFNVLHYMQTLSDRSKKLLLRN